MIKKLTLYVLCLVGAFRALHADTTNVQAISGDFQIFNQANTALSGGTPADGDGTVLQLGYYTGALGNSNNFTGTWVPLTGEGSLNTATIQGSVPFEPYFKTSIGDTTANFAADGTYALSFNFVPGDSTSDHSLPAANTILSIRFYNSTTIASSTFYNAVSDDAWKWKAPDTPTSTVSMSLNDPGLEWLSVFLGQDASTAFHTTVPIQAVPEPSTIIGGLLAVSALGFHAVRRRWRAS